MGVLWLGAAPGVRLFVGDETTAWVGIYQVDWSIRGAGSVFALWRDAHLRVLGTNADLSEWMIEAFMAPMNRSAALGGVAWSSVAYELAEMEVEIDLDTGARVRAGDVEMQLMEPLDRQLVHRDPYALDGSPHRMSFVNLPCARGRIAVAGVELPGLPRLWTDDQGRLRSTAQLAVAEAWSD
jgi:hypothetical protein